MFKIGTSLLAMFAIGVFGAALHAKPWSPAPVGRPTFVSPHASPIAVQEGRVFVANTAADTVDVIESENQKIIARVKVGVDPVSIAVRPDGKELWVSNHVSDSVSVIDIDRRSKTCFHVIATVQQFDADKRSTRFDEPVGIAFASNEKAYVALSSENRIAVVDVATRKVVRSLRINAQDPRAIVVRGDRLYVIPFESNNQTQLSGGGDKFDGDLVTFNAYEHSIVHNNVLSLGHVVDIVKHPRVPDRDLFVFNTKTDKLIETVDTLGTLLYGLTVDSKGRVFIAQTDARNEINGRAGTKNHGLKELENRAFLNRITRVRFEEDEAQEPTFIDLEPLPPQHPKKEAALATPFAIQITNDDKTLIATAAGSDKLFTVNARTGELLGSTTVGAVPRGVALESSDGETLRVWVFNAVANTVSVVDVTDLSDPQVVSTIELEDPTHAEVKRGRIAFNTASASTTGTFSCASCHPDGHTDQLLWVLKTPIVTGGDQIMPRSTMPIRGLRDTAPFHWDGIPGDPYGGNNSANVHGRDKPNSKIDNPASSTRHLIDGGIAGTMSTVGDKTVNDEGKAGALTSAERNAMATFLLSVPYPPAQRRSYSNEVSEVAKRGFELFHEEGDDDPTKSKPNVCGNCHRMPFLVSTNTPGTGMDAPTWRGAYDRFLILPQGRLNIIDFDFYRRVAEAGQDERRIWQFSWAGRRRFDPVWNMVLEGSTGFSGSFGRQLTLNQSTVEHKLTKDLLAALETSAAEGAIVLEVDGVLLAGDDAKPLELQFNNNSPVGVYVSKTSKSVLYTIAQLFELAMKGEFVGTFTARHGEQADVEHPQPAIWTLGPIEQQRGRQAFPILHADNKRMVISGRHISAGAIVIMNGRRAKAVVELKENERVEIAFSKLPANGMHLLQVQNKGGLFSNDFIFHVTDDAEAAAELKRKLDQPHISKSEAITSAIAADDWKSIERLLGKNPKWNAQQLEGGATLLSTAALYGRVDIAKQLIARGAKPAATNADGNTPLHVAAFLCRTDVVKLLLEKGASPTVKNNRGESAIDSVSGSWSKQLADFYSSIGRSSGQSFDLKSIESERPKLSKRLKQAASD